MPIYELLWVLLAVLLIVCRGLTEYTNNRAKLLKQILLTGSSMSLKHKRNQGRSYSPGNTGNLALECCPSITQGIAPLGGISKEGTLLQLFRDSNTIQKFYETTCAPHVLGEPCRFIDHTVWQSRCEQKYTYMYAIVKDFNVTQPYRIDYMKVKSACTCTITGRANNQRNFDEIVQEVEQLEQELLGV